MSYNKKIWANGDLITKESMNNIENGIYDAHDKINTINNKVEENTTDTNTAKQDISDIKLQIGTEELTTNAKEVKGAINEVNSQINEIVNVADLAQEGNNVYIKDSNGNKVGNGITIQTSGTSTSSVRLYNTEPIGELFDEPTGYTYLSWPAGNLKYDKNIDKYVCIVNAADKHIFTTLKQYICFINPDTFEVSELTKIVVTDVTLDPKAICNLTILDDGSYMMIALVDSVNHKIVSSDNGTTWMDAGAITGNTSQHFWAIYKLSNGRLIGSIDVANCGLWYSDDNGSSWTNVIPSGRPGDYNAEGCVIELSENKLMCIARKSMHGSGGYAPNTNNYSGPSEHAIISYSDDNGTTWSEWTESSTIDNMNGSCCTGVVHDNLVEIFAASRWYVTQNYVNDDYTNTGKCGAITHYTATVENALNDNFTNNGIVAYANAVGKGSSQDFHCPCIATKNNDMLLVYFDRIGNGSEENTNYYFIRGSFDKLTYKPVDNFPSSLFGYTGKKIDNKLLSLKTELILMINEVLNGGTVTPPEDVYIPTSDGMVVNFDFLDITTHDTTAMKVTDKKNGIVGYYRTANNTNSPLVTSFPTNTGKYLDSNSYTNSFVIEGLNNLISTASDFSFEVTFYIGESIGAAAKWILQWNNGGSNSTRLGGGVAQPLYLSTDGSSYKYNISNIDLYSKTNMFVHCFVNIYSDGSYKTFINNQPTKEQAAASDFSTWDSRIATKPIFSSMNLISIRFYSKALTTDEINNNYMYEYNRFNE